MKESEVAQSCPALCDPMDCSPPGFSIHGIFQAWVLEWVAISFSRGSSRPSNWTRVSCVADRHFTTWTTRESNPVNKLLTHTHTHTHRHILITVSRWGFPGDSGVKNAAANAGNVGSLPGWGRPPGAGNGNPLQESCPGNPMDRGAWWATFQAGLKESATT